MIFKIYVLLSYTSTVNSNDMYILGLAAAVKFWKYSQAALTANNY